MQIVGVTFSKLEVRCLVQAPREIVVSLSSRTAKFEIVEICGNAVVPVLESTFVLSPRIVTAAIKDSKEDCLHINAHDTFIRH